MFSFAFFILNRNVYVVEYVTAHISNYSTRLFPKHTGAPDIFLSWSSCYCAAGSPIPIAVPRIHGVHITIGCSVRTDGLFSLLPCMDTAKQSLEAIVVFRVYSWSEETTPQWELSQSHVGPIVASVLNLLSSSLRNLMWDCPCLLAVHVVWFCALLPRSKEHLSECVKLLFCLPCID